MKIEPITLEDGWTWWRIADRAWNIPLDPTFAQVQGGRWNPPKSFPTLYVNEDKHTARHNLKQFVSAWPYEPEDLRPDTGPILIGLQLPRKQVAANATTADGLKKLGLPATYPYADNTVAGNTDQQSNLIPHHECQSIGAAVKAHGFRGVYCRSAQDVSGTSHELAWFPASSRSVARIVATLRFDRWYWGKNTSAELP